MIVCGSQVKTFSTTYELWQNSSRPQTHKINLKDTFQGKKIDSGTPINIKDSSDERVGKKS